MIRILSPLFFLFALLNADDVVLERVFKILILRELWLLQRLRTTNYMFITKKEQICDSVPLQLLKYPIL